MNLMSRASFTLPFLLEDLSSPASPSGTTDDPWTP